MANLDEIKKFLDGLHGSQIYSAGILGTTGQVQNQIDKLRYAFIELSKKPDDKKAKDNFYKSLMTAHALGAVSEEELQNCRSWLE
jgi:hypothetical protein